MIPRSIIETLGAVYTAPLMFIMLVNVVLTVHNSRLAKWKTDNAIQ